jgi:hypothetical protein
MCEENKCKGYNDDIDCYLMDGKEALVEGSLDRLVESFCVSCRRKVSEILKEETTLALEWMTTAMKWREDELRGNEDGLEGGYSEELTKAINLLERWKEQ